MNSIEANGQSWLVAVENDPDRFNPRIDADVLRHLREAEESRLEAAHSIGNARLHILGGPTSSSAEPDDYEMAAEMYAQAAKHARAMALHLERAAEAAKARIR